MVKKNRWRKKTEADEFMEGVNIRQPKKIKRIRHYLLISCVAFIFFAVLWAYFSKVDIVIKGIGSVEPTGKIRVIQHLEGGIVKLILVHEGERVEENQILMRIDAVNYVALYREGLAKTAALKAKVARLTAEADGIAFSVDAEFSREYPQYVDSERKAYLSNLEAQKDKITTLQKQLLTKQQQLSAIEAHIDRLQRGLSYAKKEQKMTQNLYQQGAAAQVEVLHIDQQAADMEGQIKESDSNKKSAEEAVLEARSKLQEIKSDFQSNAAKELVTAMSELAGQEETNVSLQDRASRTVLKSPINGIIKTIYVNTIGGTVKPGEKLMEIVPTGEALIIETRVQPHDIAFVHVGQKAMVKLTAYDYLVYGGLEGKVIRVSADSITNEEGESYYIVEVKTDKDYVGTKQKPLTIMPGMTAQVDIITDKRSILTQLLKPLLRGSKEALGER